MSLSRWLHDFMHAKYGNLISIEVTKAEFIVLLIRTGKSEEATECSAKVCASLGSFIVIGDYQVGIKDA